MKKHFVLCIDDGGYPESLEKRKFYEALDDPEAFKEDLVRIVDESGEDYLYAKDMFLDTNLPQQLKKALETIS